MRNSKIQRKTNETDVEIELNIDGKGNLSVETGLGFLDHMLTLFAKHGFFDLKLSCLGDLDIDGHHSVEDIGITLGKAFKEALGKKEKIKRYSTCFVPMDEAFARVSVDVSGRAYLVYDVEIDNGKIGDVDTELFEEFFRAFAFNANITLHISLLYGKNSHHKMEAIFKAFAKALDEATKCDDRIEGVMSTKGIL